MPARVARPRQTEKDLQEAIVQILTLHGWLCIEYGKCGGHGALRGAVPPGHPDIIAFKRGKGLLFEAKTPTGHTSRSQHTLHGQLAAHGVLVHVVRSADEALQIAQEAFS